MNRLFSYLIVSISLIATTGVEARGGFGGGRPGGGFHLGAGGGGGAVRPTPLPSPRPGICNRPGTLPVRPGQPGPGRPGNGSIGGRPGGGITPLPGNGQPVRPGGRPGVGTIGGRPIGNVPGTPGTPGSRPGYMGYHKSEMNVNIQKNFRYSPTLGYPLSRNWSASHHWHYTSWPYWRGFATGAAISSWLRWPAYNGYGSSTTLVYYPYNPAPAGVYDQSVAVATQVVDAGQAPVADAAEWLSIGAFGIIPANQSDFAYSIQLASTSDGSLRGMQWNMSDNSVIEVVGSIVSDTLRVAWQQKDSPNAPIFETTVDQLTQQESYINVYDPSAGSLISWQMIQIAESDLPPQNSISYF